MFRLVLVPILTLVILIGTHPAHAYADACQEDQACWDCSTMGNRVCGPPVLVCQPTQRDGQLYLDQCDWSH